MEGYSDDSIYMNLLVSMSDLNYHQIMTGLIESAKINLTESQMNDLFASNPNFSHPQRLIRDLNLQGFSETAWNLISTTQSHKADRYVEIKDNRIYETIIRSALQYLTKQPKPILLNTFLLGDFQEILNAVGVLIDPKFRYSMIELDWTGFTPDPYEFLDNRSEEKKTTSQSHPIYDTYLGSKWFSGVDGTGRLTSENIKWIADNQFLKSFLVVGALRRLNYQDDSVDMIKLYYKLCVGILASLQTGGLAVMKISLPVNRAILGIYGLFALFFPQVRIIKLKQANIDDNTVYLIGVGNLGVPPNIFAFLLDSEENMYKILNYLGGTSNNIYDDLNRILRNDIENWIQIVENVWSL